MKRTKTAKKKAKAPTPKPVKISNEDIDTVINMQALIGAFVLGSHLPRRARQARL